MENSIPNKNIYYRKKYHSRPEFWLCMLTFLAYMVPTGLSYINNLEKIENLWRLWLIGMFGILLIMQIWSRTISMVVIYTVLLLFDLFIMTYINEGYWFGFFEKALFLMGALFLVSIFTKKDAALLIRAGLAAFTIIFFLNLMGILWKYPHSFRAVGDFWLFGQKNNIKKMVMPLLMFSFLDDYINDIRLSKRTLFWLIACPAIVFIMKSTTVFIFLVAMEIFYVINVKTHLSFDILKFYFILFVCLFLLLVLFRNVGFFGRFITQVLNKSNTLSGRTFIWDVAAEKIAQNPILGTGIQSLENTGLYTKNNIFSQCHNMILELLYKGGIGGFLSFWMIWFYCTIRLGKTQDAKMRFIFELLIGTWLCFSEFAEFWYFEHFFTLYLASQASRIIEEKRKVQNVRKN